jgi:hypothetical protein
MSILEKVQAELFAIQMEKHKAELRDRLDFQRELRKSFGIKRKLYFAPQAPKTPTPIAIQRKKRREEKAQIAKQNRSAQLALFTKQQEEKALAILKGMENPK